MAQRKATAPNPTENLPGWAEFHARRLAALPSFNTMAGGWRKQGRRRALRSLYADLHEFDPITRDRAIRDMLDLVDLYLNAEV